MITRPILLALAALSLVQPASAGQLTGYKLLLTSIRTGDTEVFVVDPDTGDAFNVSRSPQSEDRYPCWSPDGKRIAFTSDRNHSTNLYVVATRRQRLEAGCDLARRLLHAKLAKDAEGRTNRLRHARRATGDGEHPA